MAQMPNLSLDRIPIDIVRLFINSLDPIAEIATLQNLRLTCRLLNDLATSQLFHALTFRAQNEVQIRQQIAPKYLRHVRWLSVNCCSYIQCLVPGLALSHPICLSRFMDLLTQMPQLERLWLRGSYNCDKGCIGVSDDEGFDPDHNALDIAAFLMNMSCLTPRRKRIETNLRFLYLDLDMMRRDENWYLARFLPVFFIPSLRVLTAKGMGLAISSGGPPLPTEHIGESGLRKLKLINAGIEMPFLESLLMLPTALEELSLRGRTIVLPDSEEDIYAVRKFQRAAERQSASLKVLELNEGLHAADETVLGGVIDLSKFVALRRYEGYYEDVSKRF
ncbi:hypothetical protein BDW42DRAFT_169599 [Aspergillus taichungensis]|uniref:F-box domain-containing protein n=1 Tax=Aspergillus taichungensis TaxID=482145 RepID=A0A2J5HUS8_9EURO|nr:hypothetical protein BDW42DRAFT_169599 [Aspergillus taichungensis]